MLERLGERIMRHRLAVLVGTVGLLVCAVLLGQGVAERLTSGGFHDPGSSAARAEEVLQSRFASGQSNFALVVTAQRGANVDDTAVRRKAVALAAQLRREPNVQHVTSYWAETPVPALRSTDGRSGLILAQLTGADTQINRSAGELASRYRGVTDTVAVEVAGSATVQHDMQSTLEKDLHRAELYALPLTMLLLLWVFGSVVAAVLPLVIGGIAVIGTLLVLRLLTTFTEVSVFALNITTAVGLGLAIDYSLLVVSRFREFQETGLGPRAAAVRTISTAGRTVLYSAATVGLSLAAMLAFPQPFLRSLALAGISVVVLASAAAVVVLPAALAIIGAHLNRGTVRRRRIGGDEGGRNTWSRIAITVMRRPLLIVIVTVTFLIALGLPFMNAQFALADDRVLPESAPSRIGNELLRNGFRSQEQDALIVVSDRPANDGDVGRYAAALSRIPGVSRVDTTTGSYKAGKHLTGSGRNDADGAKGFRASVIPGVPTYSPAAERIVASVRDVPAPVPVDVGGQAAVLVDTKQAISDRLPIALGIIATSIGLLLFLFTGSLLVPIKAVLLNLLSLSATFGVMVWGFQEGHLHQPLHFTVTGALDVATPVLMFCVAFGLSMDYEVFVLSRIHEEWRRTRDNTQAVAAGLQHTGGLVTAGALLMSIVFVSSATSEVTTLKMMGVGLALAVLMDAALIRTVLVPALMRLAGDYNWWAPTALRRLHARFGLREESDPPTPPYAVSQQSVQHLPDRIISGEPMLRYRDPSGNQHVVDLRATYRLSIGRGLATDVCLRWDMEVSRLHAELERVGEDWILVDDGLSRNGSYVNGIRVVERRRLCNGDELVFGGTAVVFHAPSPLVDRNTKARPLTTFLSYEDPTAGLCVADLSDSDQLSIGRSPQRDVCLAWDMEVSRLHAELKRLGEDWVLLDDSLSRNGSYVNGERLIGRRRLQEGDRLVLGATMISYHCKKPQSLTTVR